MLLAVLVGATDSAAAPRPPNVILVLADDLGYGDLGCYGSTVHRTPHIDRLAAEGLRFTDFHSSGAVCSPTRAALLTGRYPQRAGIDGVINADPAANRHHGLAPLEVTVAERLATGGYARAILGKWHLGYDPRFNPLGQGFETFRGYVSGNIDYRSHFDRMGFEDWWRDRELEPEEGYVTHLITRHAVDAIRRLARRTPRRPFFLYVAHEAPHSPFQGPGDSAFRVRGRPVAERRTHAERARAYREMVEELDAGVGEILAALRETDLERDTLVLFLSDNGAARPGSNGPLRGFKGSLDEGGHRVPAIARWPGTVAPGGDTDRLATTLDVFPTLLELASLDPDAKRTLDGESLAPLLRGEPSTATTRRVFWEHGDQRAVREGPWKLLWRHGRKPALHHLGRDIGEARDLSATEPDRVSRMLGLWKEWKDDVERTRTPQPPPMDAPDR